METLVHAQFTSTLANMDQSLWDEETLCRITAHKQNTLPWKHLLV